MRQALHAEELSEINSKLQASLEDNKALEEKEEALQHDLSGAEDELISLRKMAENLKNERNELERNQEQLQKELEEQGKYRFISIRYYLYTMDRLLKARLTLTRN